MDLPLSQEMIDALLKKAAEGAPEASEMPTEDQDTSPDAGGAAAPAPGGGAGAAAAPAPAMAAAPDSVAASARPVVFSPLPASQPTPSGASINLLLDVPLQVTVELGRTHLSVRDVLALGPGSVVELDRLAGEPVDLLVNSLLIARGEVVVIDESFGVRVTEIVRRQDVVA